MEKIKLLTPGNIVSFIRLIPLYCSIILLVLKTSTELKIAAIALLLLTFLLDSLDGYVARKTKTISKFGSMIDVIIDRIVEASYWIAFLYLGLVPLWIVLAMQIRYFITDGFRTLAFSKGLTTFEMMKSSIGNALVASRISRGIINGLKIITFTYLGILTFSFSRITENLVVLKEIGFYLALALLCFNLVRGFYTVKDTIAAVNRTK